MFTRNRLTILAVAAILGFASTASAAILVDINADGTNRTATVADFEDAIGLASGSFSGSSVVAFNSGGTGSGPFNETVSDITIDVSSISGDADNWFGGGSSNNLLEDGFFADPGVDQTITLSGSGLGLAANTSYTLYLFAGRRADFNQSSSGANDGGHSTRFTFNSESIDAGAPIFTPSEDFDETLGTVAFDFTTGGTAPTDLVVTWRGTGTGSTGADDSAFSGFALHVVVVPEPSSLLLALVGLGLLAVRRRR